MINIFIVEDHTVVIEGIQTLLQDEKDVMMAGSSPEAHPAWKIFNLINSEKIII